MARCAGVQNVSRPMVRCHEMSQRMPTTMAVAPSMTMRLTHDAVFRCAGESAEAIAGQDVDVACTGVVLAVHGGCGQNSAGTIRKARKCIATDGTRIKHRCEERKGM